MFALHVVMTSRFLSWQFLWASFIVQKESTEPPLWNINIQEPQLCLVLLDIKRPRDDNEGFLLLKFSESGLF